MSNPDTHITEDIPQAVIDEAWSEYLYPRAAVDDLAEPPRTSGFVRAMRVLKAWAATTGAPVNPEQTTDAAALGPHHPAGSPEGHFRPDPQMGQQHADRTPVTDDMVDAVEQAWPRIFLDGDSGWREKLRALIAAALAGCTVVPNEPERLEAYDANALNVVTAALTDLYGFLPLDVRYQAAAVALRTVNDWQSAGSVSLKGDTNGQ